MKTRKLWCKGLGVLGILTLAFSPVYAENAAIDRVEEVQIGDSADEGTCIKTEDKAVLSSLAGSYNKAKEKNWVVTDITYNGDQLEGVSFKGQKLEYEEDYCVGAYMGGMCVRFTEEFLEKLSVGRSEVTFEFDKTGKIPYYIYVVDVPEEEIQDAVVTTYTNEYELNSSQELLPGNQYYINIQLNGNELIGIHTDKALEPGYEYNKGSGLNNSECWVKIPLEYLDQQGEGEVVFTLDFDKGKSQTVTVNVIPMNTTAEVSDTEFTYDKNEPSNIEIWMEYHHNKVLSITYQGRELKWLEEYEPAGITTNAMGIWLTEEFLQSLSVGKHEILFNFDLTGSIPVKINVVDNSKTNENTIRVGLNGTADANSNVIGNTLTFKVDGEAEYDISKLKVRYYYTKEGEVEEEAVVDNAGVNYTIAPWYVSLMGSVKATIHKTDLESAKYYLEIGFDKNASLNQDAQMTIATRIHKIDWSNYDQMNDYSYNDASKICVYYDGQLISGTEPEK